MMFANLTGNSCLRKANDVLSHAFSEPEGCNHTGMFLLLNKQYLEINVATKVISLSRTATTDR